MDLKTYQEMRGVHIVRVLKEKAGMSAALVCRGEEQFVCRIYEHPVPAYKALAGLDVPELPRLLSYSESDGGCIVEEEYIEGISLGELTELYLPDCAQTAAICRKLCRALQELHKRGIIHRDVKPENIMVCSSGRGVLLDLDASSRHDPTKNMDTSLMGTAGYAAPEQFGFGRCDMRSDIFSVGVLMNTMLTGRHPSHTLAEGELRPVIEKCIEVNAAKRYAGAAELGRRLDKFIAPDRVCPECGFVSPGGGCVFCGVPSGGRKRKARLWPAAAAAIILCAALLLTLPGEKESAGDPTADTPAAETGELPAATGPVSSPPLPEPEESPVPEKTEVQIQFEEYAGDVRYDGRDFFYKDDIRLSGLTAFSYDLDGDGREESYYFGVLTNIEPEPRFISIDSVGRPHDENDAVYRTAAPAVFTRLDEEQYVPVEAFAELLSGQKVTLSYSGLRFGEEAVMPKVYAAPELFGIWPGAVEIEYRIGSIGGWVMEACAEIDGAEYTAFSLTKLRSDWCGIELEEQE